MTKGSALRVSILAACVLDLVAFSQPPPVYVIGATFIRPAATCPYYVSGVVPNAPADLAGLREGDELIAVNGVDVSRLLLGDVVKLIRSEAPGDVALTVRSHENVRVVTVARESRLAVREKESVSLRRAGKKIVHDAIVPLDTTEAEVQRMETFDGGRIVTHVFPLHYPTDPNVYSGGFELFLLRAPAQVVVGGIEDGPAARAGVHWGDVILDIDGVSPNSKSASELAAFLTGYESRAVHMKLDRLGSTKNVTFALARTTDLLKQNRQQIVNGAIIPSIDGDDFIKCLHSTSQR